MNAKGEAKIEPWYSFSSTEPAPDSTGDIMIQAVDSSGAVLASRQINLQFYVRTNPPSFVDWAPFEGAIRFPEKTAKFQIVQKGSKVFEIAVSANDPVVSGVFPTASASILDGPQTITWSASDPDGDALKYIVEYNPNPADANSEWLVLAADITTLQWQDDFGTLPGTKSGLIRVTATDGIRSTVAQSQSFSVSFKAPLVFIDALPNGNVFKLGSEIFLSGEAEDLQDGILDDQNLVWSSNISGTLGSGNEIVVTKLPAGDHTITLKATNSAGLTATQTISIKVQ
jgi:hypothetical protein